MFLAAVKKGVVIAKLPVPFDSSDNASFIPIPDGQQVNIDDAWDGSVFSPNPNIAVIKAFKAKKAAILDSLDNIDNDVDLKSYIKSIDV